MKTTFYTLLSCFISFSIISCDARERLDAGAISSFNHLLTSLKHAKDSKDSIGIIQVQYLDKIKNNCQPFIKEKGLTARKIYESMSLFPKFYNQLANYKTDFKSINDTINYIDKKIGHFFDGYKEIKVVLLVGDLSVGGTVDENIIYICLEMIADNGITDKSELPPYLKSLSEKGTLFAYLAHESVHTIQAGFPLNELTGRIIHGKNSLLYTCLLEGSAEYISYYLFGTYLNKSSEAYFMSNRKRIWTKFTENVEKTPYEYNQWIYSFRPNDGRPADLGYYLGFKICEAFMNLQSDKKKGLNCLINRNKFKYVYKKSLYNVE
ncbi:DUF2268 domain-containing putative Zn-dependent protease [Flavobacterium cyanobacteriorum]|nr:DUF2268 domain-containing putative Zn-dependent protease [Flavobacterium cyanobacteriorum]